VSSAPIAKGKSERREEQRHGGIVNVGFAARFLGTSPAEVIRLCKAGMLLAQQHGPSGFWQIDKDDLTHWREAPDEGAAAAAEGANDEEAVPLLPTEPPPPNSCAAHWARRGRVVRAFRLGLCRPCFDGKPLLVKPDEGEASLD
jgi:hypothetical protein